MFLNATSRRACHSMKEICYCETSKTWARRALHCSHFFLIFRRHHHCVLSFFRWISRFILYCSDTDSVAWIERARESHNSYAYDLIDSRTLICFSLHWSNMKMFLSRTLIREKNMCMIFHKRHTDLLVAWYYEIIEEKKASQIFQLIKIACDANQHKSAGVRIC